MEVSCILGRIVKGVGGTYLVDVDGKIYPCKSRKTVKNNSGNILIGDMAEILYMDNDTYVIEKVTDRKNALIRPLVSNIDKVLILISKSPTPDFYLIDKMLVSLSMKGIEPYIVVTKSDQNVSEVYEKVLNDYSGQVKKIFAISSLNENDVNKIKEELKGSLTCLVGQSAVGKTTLLNALNPSVKFEVGEVSKINRGRHTTRHSEIIGLGDNTYIIDTPGFSFLDLEIDPLELKKHYYDFNEYIDHCKYRGCNHINEPDCAVKKAVEEKKISIDRYNRYLELYNELLQKWRKKYG